jgi:hypothetical protein
MASSFNISSQILQRPLAKSLFYHNDAVSTGNGFTTTTSIAGYITERVFWDSPTVNDANITMNNGVWSVSEAGEYDIYAHMTPRFTNGGYYSELVEITSGVAVIIVRAKLADALGSNNERLPGNTLNYRQYCDPTKYYAIQLTGGWTTNGYNTNNKFTWLEIVKRS